MNKDTKKINITLPSELILKIKAGNYNRNQLIISLLKQYKEKK
jgi:hypothetical protein